MRRSSGGMMNPRYDTKQYNTKTNIIIVASTPYVSTMNNQNFPSTGAQRSFYWIRLRSWSIWKRSKETKIRSLQTVSCKMALKIRKKFEIMKFGKHFKKKIFFIVIIQYFFSKTEEKTWKKNWKKKF